MKKIQLHFLVLALITLSCLLNLPLSAGDNDSGAGTWTPVWGQASVYNIWYDDSEPETVNSIGTLYLRNNSEDPSYEFEWGARLEIMGYGPDVKHASPGRVWIAPGATYNNPQNLYQIVDVTGAPRGQRHSMIATYWLTVFHPIWANRTDAWQANLTGRFDHILR